MLRVTNKPKFWLCLLAFRGNADLVDFFKKEIGKLLEIIFPFFFCLYCTLAWLGFTAVTLNPERGRNLSVLCSCNRCGGFSAG